jgi:hypothetical protein
MRDLYSIITLRRLLPAASSDTRPGSATHGFRALPVTAEPSGCPFPRRSVVRGRSVIQALVPLSRRIRHQFQIFRTEVLHFLKPCDLIAERTFPVFVDFLNITDTRSVSSGFGSSDAQTRGSDRNGMCFI